MEIIRQEKVIPMLDKITGMEVGEIKWIAEDHKGAARSAISKLKDRDYITASRLSANAEPCLVVVRIL